MYQTLFTITKQIIIITYRKTIKMYVSTMHTSNDCTMNGTQSTVNFISMTVWDLDANFHIQTEMFTVDCVQRNPQYIKVFYFSLWQRKWDWIPKRVPHCGKTMLCWR